MKMLIRKIESCVQCPYYSDEGDFCTHPDLYRVIRDDEHPMPDDCPLPDFIKNDKDVIEDGFGNAWSAYCPECGQRTMQVIRPGKCQCSECG